MTRSKKKVHILEALLVNIINFEKPFVTINVDFFDCQNIFYLWGENNRFYASLILLKLLEFFLTKRT